MSVVDKFYKGSVGNDSVVRFADGALPTVDELTQLRDSAYIFESVFQATMAERERLLNAPRCPHCNSLLTNAYTTSPV